MTDIDTKLSFCQSENDPDSAEGEDFADFSYGPTEEETQEEEEVAVAVEKKAEKVSSEECEYSPNVNE